MAQQLTNSLDSHFKKTHAKAVSSVEIYSETCQTSKMELLPKTLNS